MLAVRAAPGSPLQNSGEQSRAVHARVMRLSPSVNEKEETSSEAGMEGPGDHTAGVGPVIALMGGSWTRPERLMVSSPMAKSAISRRLKTLWRLYACDTLLERLAQDVEDVAAELRQFIENEHAMVGERDVAGHRHLADPDQPHIRDGVVRGTKRSRGDKGGAIAGEAGAAMDARDLDGFGEGHIRQDGGEPPGRHRLPRPVITFHCSHRHSLRAPALHGPLQKIGLKGSSWSDQDRCRLIRTRPLRPVRTR
jgi:hypothetical protein